MTDRARLVALAALLAARRDARLAALARAARARAAVVDRIATLDAPGPPHAAEDPVTAAQQGLRYMQWTAAQRMSLNRELATRTATWMTARDAARTDLGRAAAMEGLLERLRRRDQES